MVDEREKAESTGESTTPGNEDRVESLEKELAQEREKAEKYLDNWRRAQADFINFKRRSEQQREEEVKLANMMTVSAILPVLDDMERALQTIPAQLAGFTWFEGTLLIYHKLKARLEECGVKEIKAEGEPFDPVLHEAVTYVDGEEGKVITQFQRGYKLYDRVIRPAIVAVGNGTKSSENKGQEG